MGLNKNVLDSQKNVTRKAISAGSGQKGLVALIEGNVAPGSYAAVSAAPVDVRYSRKRAALEGNG